MNKYSFKRLYYDLAHRVEDEGKKNPSWLMGYLQGLGSRTLTGYQCSVLVDLLLVPLENKCNGNENNEIDILSIEDTNIFNESSASESLLKTLAQR